MKVTLIAWTYMDLLAVSELEPKWQVEGGSFGELLIEYAGRNCYQSWSKPNPDTATLAGYLHNIRQQGHFSVYEHATASFDFRRMSRSFTHELVRHRHFSFSELSQRFVDMESTDLATPPALDEQFMDDSDELAEAVWAARRAYRRIYEYLTGKGLKRKQAREAARAVMPNMTETKIVVTGNLRAWRHFIKVRGSVHADAEIRGAALLVAEQLQHRFPNAMADVEYYTENDQTCVRLKEGE